MISIDLVQAEIVSVLKANGPLVGVVGDEIREEQWQGTEFSYPAIRVSVGDFPDLMGGSCPGLHGTISFRVLTFSEEASSRQADQLGGLIMGALLDEQMKTVQFISGPIRLGRRGQVSAVRTPQRVWRGEVGFACNIYSV